MTFAEFVQANGLLPNRIVPDGKWRRCGTKERPRKLNGAYRLALGGRMGWAQDWTVHTKPSVWRPDSEAEVPEVDPEALHRAWAEQRRKRREATQAARKFYAECAPLRGGHPYLEAHELDVRGCYGLKVDKLGWLVVPALKAGRLMSVQRISPDGEKRFWPGASVKGSGYVIDRQNGSITVYCEGLATGLAIFAAAPLTRVVVRFDAGNLGRVTETCTGLTVVAADNDHGTETRIGTNPGVESARKAADALGCGVAVPEGMDGSDWADWRQEQARARLEDWNRKPWEQESTIRRAVDAEIAAAMARNASFVVGER